MKTGTKVAIGAGVVGLVGAWYAIWGQWGLFAPKRTYRGITYRAGNFLCGLFQEPPPPDKPYCWDLVLPPQGSQFLIPGNLNLGEYKFASGPEANAAAKSAIDAYLASSNNQLPWPTQ